MSIHPRTIVVEEAEHAIEGFVLDLRRQHGLTDIETLQILNRAQATTLKYALRRERHPDHPGRCADDE